MPAPRPQPLATATHTRPPTHVTAAHAHPPTHPPTHAAPDPTPPHPRAQVCKEDVKDVQGEVAIMNHVCGHHHVVTLRSTHEDKDYVHIVMEL